MCLIISQAIGAGAIPPEQFKNAWTHNPDGAGYMFVADGQLQIRKPFFKLKHLLKSYRADYAAHGQTSPFVIHFRYATHGQKDEVNTHPHPLCGGQVGLVHNGILSDFEPAWGADISDTVHFCRTVLAYRCPQHVVDETFNGILADMIGKGNKLVLLSHDGTVSIVNEASGIWDGSNWYSNLTYLTPAPQPTRGQWSCIGTGKSRFKPLPVDTLFSYGPADERIGTYRDEVADVWDDLSPEERKACLDDERLFDLDLLDDERWRERVQAMELEAELDRQFCERVNNAK